LRIEFKGAFYHVTNRGNERGKIYFAKADYEKFKDYLRDGREKYGYRLHCYVLMPNHYHLLMETPNGNLSQVMHYINGSYTTHINRKRKRIGHLFQGRYRAVLIDRDSYLLELSRYVHLNPVRAKIVSRPEDYPYSSYASYISREKDDCVSHELILGMISKDKRGSRKKYREFVEKGLEKKIENPMMNVYGSAILGSRTFIRESLERLKDGILHRGEIAQRRELQAAHGSEEIIAAVCSHLKVSREDLLRRGGENRKIAIYLMKKQTGMTNKQIGDLFGGLSYSAVAKVYQRFSAEAKKNKQLRKLLKELRVHLSSVKG
jgi:REP element-mobilizing transposase RayT